MEEETEDIYSVDLHEQIHKVGKDDGISLVITRVAGGWIYSTVPYGGDVFVPFDNEFLN